MNSKWQQDLAEMHEIIRRDHYLDLAEVETPGYLSLSANGDKADLKSMQIVHLDPNRERDYLSFFYPANSGKGEGKGYLIGLFEDVANVTIRVNAFFSFMRAILQNGWHVAGLEHDPAALSAYVNGVLAQIVQKDVIGVNPAEQSKVFLERFRNGNFHTVVQSLIYKNGLDVSLSDGVTKNSCPSYMFGSHITSSANLQSKPDFAQRDRMRSWSCETGLKVLKAAQEIYEFLFGQPFKPTSVVRRRVVGINTKFDEIEKIFTRITGIKLEQTVIQNITFSRAVMEQFVAIEFLQAPSHSVIDAVGNINTQRYLDNISQNFTADTLTDSFDFIESKLQDVNNVVPEAELLNRKILSTIRFTFEEDIARYITQSPITKKVSVYAMYNWFGVWGPQFIRVANSRLAGGMAVPIGSIPRYVLPLANMPELTASRKENKLVTEASRTNDDGLFLTPDGTIEFRPDSSVRDSSNLAAKYEALCEELCELTSKNNVGLYAQISLDTHRIPVEEYQRINELRKEISAFAGTVVSWDWDYGTVSVVDSVTCRVKTSVEVGNKRPDDLAIADYLGMNLAREGQSPLQKDFAVSMYMMTTAINSLDTVRQDSGSKFGSESDPYAFADYNSNSPIKTILYFYFQQVFVHKKFPPLSELCRQAMKKLGYSELPKEGRDNYGIYSSGFIRPNGELHSRWDGTHTESTQAVSGLLKAVMNECAGGYGTNIAKTIWAENPGASRIEIEEMRDEHPDFFLAYKSPAAHFGRLYSFFGGQVFKLILGYINNMSPSDLTNFEQGKLTYESQYTGRPIEMARVNNKDIFKVVKPLAVMLGTYAPSYEYYFAKAKDQMESIAPNENFSANDLIVPGLQEGRAVFPHQLETQSYLRKKSPPPFAVLAISPGGGKTGIGTMDMAALAGELADIGEQVRPLVIAPDNLIRTWCDDIKYFLGSTWNAVPISTSVMDRWGPDRIQEVIDNAPPNTIFITGMVFMSNQRKNIVVGSSVVKVSANQEFIKRLAPNYIIIDESHKLKNHNSQRHKIVKALTTATFVKWLRIASGTLMPNTPADLEAQVALYSPQIFRRGELSSLKTEDIDEKAMKLGNSSIPSWKSDTPSRARAKLGRYAAVVYKKRKEWAWMLPSPIEMFHSVPLVDDTATGAERDQQERHNIMYEAILQETVDAIEDLLKKAESKEKRRKNNDDDDSDDDNIGSEDSDTNSSVDDIADALPEGIDLDQFKKHFSRFEQLIISPQNDIAYPTYFGNVNYVSRKAKYIASLVHKHFNPPKWNQNGTILAPDGRTRPLREYDLVEYKGDWYLARKFDTSTDKFIKLPDETIGISPDKLPDIWKKESKGKLIIITRYNASAASIKEALPEEYKRQAVVFTGDEENKWEGFERFKSDPNTTILIANEQGMSEGHNLQMASRIIRAENPWGPGEVDQTSARIFRPDPKGFADGELARDIVFLDWVLADATMEVAKQGRVIAKIFATSRVEESENPLYAQVFKDTANVPNFDEVAELRLGVAAMKNRKTLNDEPFKSFRIAYDGLNGVIRREFHEMRVQKGVGLLPVAAQSALEGSRQINAPFVPNQDIPDPHNWKPISVERLLTAHPEWGTDPEKYLQGKEVITDFGTGRIVGFNREKSKKGSVDEGGASSVRGITSLKIKFKDPQPGTKEWETFPLGVVFTPTQRVTSEQYKQFFDISLDYTQQQLKEAEKREKQLREQEEQEERERESERKRQQQRDRERIQSKIDGDKRERNIREGKPINTGVGTVQYDPNVKNRIKPGSEMTPIVRGNPNVNVHPAFFHGYLTLEAEFDTTSVNLKKLDFKFSGEYAFVTVKRYDQLAAFFDYIEEHFDISKATEDRLNDVQEAFESGKRGLYNMELASTVTLPMFFATRKRVVTNRKEIRVYPIFMSGELLLAVDIATCPAIVNHIGEKIPGAAAKWTRSAGHWHYFAQGKTDIRDKIAEIKRNGYKVVNEKEAMKELAEINFRKPRAKK